MKKTFLNRLLFSYTLFIFSVVFIIFIGYYFYILKDMRNSQEHQLDLLFTNYYDNNEKQLKNSLLVAESIKMLPSIDKFSYSSSTNYHKNMNRLFEDLKILSRNLIVDNYSLMVHKFNDETCITNDRSIKVEYMLNEYGLDKKLYYEYLTKMTAKGDDDDYVFITNSHIVYVSLKDYIDTKTVIVVSMSANTFTSIMDKEGAVFSIIGYNGNVVDVRDINANNVNKELINNTDKFLINKINNKNETLKWIFSKSANIVYTYTYNDEIIMKKINAIMLNLFIVLIIVSGLFFLIILFISIHLCKPIEKLVDTLMSYSPNNHVDEKKMNELDFIAGQVLEIRDKNSSLTNILSDHMKTSKEKFLYDLITDVNNKSEQTNNLERFGLNILDNKNIVVIFDINSSISYDYVNRVNVINDTVFLLEDRLSQKFSFIKVNISDKLCCFIVNCETIETLEVELIDIVSIIDTALDIFIPAFCGIVSNNSNELHLSYNCAFSIIEARNLIPPKNVYTFTDISDLPLEVPIYSLEIESKLIMAIEKNNYDEAMLLIDSIFTNYVAKNFDIKDRREFVVFALANTMNRAALKVGINLADFFKDGYMFYIQLKLCNNLDSLKEYLVGAYDQIFKQLQSNNIVRNEVLQNKLVSYINVNLQHDISLLDLSQAFNLSPNYMSSMFKNIIGDNFKEYISKCRYEKAVDILNKNSKIKLSDLANEVGVNNALALSRLFKKYYGNSPSHYIKEHNLT